ncbi:MULTISPECIES: ABC transporter permease [Rhodococcus]|uniref:FtsX-like permease family protein n=1 Tax=Rhodococcus oxybenzonivorans TaxID=1990687 RepID=A0AAE4UWR7_9NOCA|nr:MULTISPECIES: FtsX-like permease family protein [Rhodococcus]MDV7245628.1 FtsX-like permease family protein [Rhodococcus oxybenzonivorans]MDV7264373.1 FtsX-like permease family protein [Rhodococcus oxybenzonivorans]MDV7277017.1 FtsX-like permease family protein [Rhodococcus oxybenzonivorans]MDV7336651.1 FtsX-like permease family protein [Rhodococcus oxybenzonivorans]MDV7346529.1 FtsX-like permease family protein [Rhodococcus oxybenzonivorans]
MASTSRAPMRKVSLRNLAAHKVRLALTVLSVVLGTAFVAGSFVFTDTLQKTFDSIFENTAQGVDVRVSSAEENSRGIPLADVDTVVAVDGVRKVAPSVSGQIVLIGSDGAAVQTGGAPSVGESYLPPDQALGEADEYLEGTPPAEVGQIAVNASAAERAGLTVGDTTKVLVPARGMVDVTVSGIYSTGNDTGGFLSATFVDSQARELFTDGEHVEYLDVAGTGLSQTDLRDRIAAALPDAQVQTGDEVREETKAEISEALSFVNYFLLAFGAIALLVGTFIIYNTFSMIVAQRLRELALLRAIGASRQQVGRSVVFEALVVGVIGSAIGIAAGIGLAYGLRTLLNAFDLGLPEGPLQVGPRTILVALVIGVVVTTVSAYAPARRAAKVPPVAAMREEFASTGDSLRIRTIGGAVLGAVGVVGLVVGSRGTGGGAAAVVGIGALGLILAVLFAAPALSRPVVGALGAVLAKPFGPIGRLARTNAVRNPRRTAATAFALTLGLMLVSVIGVFGSSAKTGVNQLVDVGVTADYILTGPNQIGVPSGAARAVRNLDSVQSATALHPVSVTVDDEAEQGASLEGPIDGVLDYTLVEGAADLTANHLLVSQTAATDKGWTLGSTVPMKSADGKVVDAEVAGVFEDNQLIGEWVVSDDVYRQVMPAATLPAFTVLIDAKPGTDLTQLRSDLEAATKQFVVVQVQDREQFKGTQGAQIDTLLAILYGLLALAVVIAILGIINTLALSVVERRREIGMLRAVGMQRAQMRRTIYLESMLIAVFGAAVGVLLGIAFGWGFVSTLKDQGLEQVTVPWGQVTAMLLGSGVVGVLAALWPASRAARTRPLEAIADL